MVKNILAVTAAAALAASPVAAQANTRAFEAGVNIDATSFGIGSHEARHDFDGEEGAYLRWLALALGPLALLVIIGSSGGGSGNPGNAASPGTGV